MKKKEIRQVLEALKRIRMPKIEDVDLRNKIIKLHITLLGEAKKCDTYIEGLRTAHLGAYEDEVRVYDGIVAKLRVETDPAKIKELVKERDSHTELKKAIDELYAAANAFDNEEIQVDTIPADKFVEEYGKQDYDMSVVESLAPILDI